MVAYPDLSPAYQSLGLTVGGFAQARRGHFVEIKSSFTVGENTVFVDNNGYQYRADGTESFDRELTSPWDLVKLVSDDEGKDYFN